MRPRLPASASRKRRIQRVFWGLLTALTLGGLLIFLNVRSYSRLICPDVAAAPIRPVAIVFGAASVVLTDRVATAILWGMAISIIVMLALFAAFASTIAACGSNDPSVDSHAATTLVSITLANMSVNAGATVSFAPVGVFGDGASHAALPDDTYG